MHLHVYTCASCCVEFESLGLEKAKFHDEERVGKRSYHLDRVDRFENMHSLKATLRL